jgi:hypothetical protein
MRPVDAVESDPMEEFYHLRIAASIAWPLLHAVCQPWGCSYALWLLHPLRSHIDGWIRDTVNTATCYSQSAGAGPERQLLRALDELAT